MTGRGEGVPRLTAHAPDLWTAEGPFRTLGIDLGTRMTVIRLADGGLFLHSPIAPDPDLREELDAIGPVRFLVAPNLMHHLSVGDWVRACPDARLFGPAGLASKRRDLQFHASLDDRVSAPWSAEIGQLLFQGQPRLDEFVFHHPASRTLLLTDLAFNVSTPRNLGARIFLAMNGRGPGFGSTRLVRTLVRDRRAARASMERILALDFDRVTLTHGEVLETGGRERLRAAWTWL